MRGLPLFLVVIIVVGTQATSTYDFVVIGSGGAGSVLGADLSANDSVTVLVLEEGEDRSLEVEKNVFLYGDINADPTVASDFSNRIVFNKHLYTQEKAMAARSLYYPLPNLAGGAASVNGNAFNCPTRKDFEGWKVTGWTYDELIDDYRSLETYAQCFTTGCNTTVHGTSGPINVTSIPPDANLQHVKEAIATVFGLSENDDTNDGDAEGIGIMTRNIDVTNAGPRRQDSFSQVLKPVLSRTNLKLLTSAYVLAIRINPNGTNEVVYLNSNKTTVTVQVTKEIVISAGVMGSPKILLLSGIGNCTQLESLGIECVVNNTNVGKNLRESVLTTAVYISALPPPPFSNGSIISAYYKSPGYDGPTTNMEISATGLFTSGFYVIGLQLTHLLHSDVGEIYLKSDFALENPRVTLNLYKNESEIGALVDQFKKMRLAMNMITMPDPLNLFSFIPQYVEIAPGYQKVPPTATDADIATYLKGSVNPAWHAVGTCSIKKVVDERLRLIDGNGNIIQGIRVADNSIIPERLSTHATSCSAMWIGKIASRLIKEDWNL